MRNRVGKCPVCGRRVAIYSSINYRPDASTNLTRGTEIRMVIASHLPVEQTTPTDPTIRIGQRNTCVGWMMTPAHDPRLEKERTRRRAKRFALVEPFRHHAMVAHDAYVDGRRFPDADRDVLVRVAVFEYTFHFPDATTVAAVRFVRAKSNQGLPLRTGDFYCSFCGELVVRTVKADHWGRMEPGRVIAAARRSHHATRCALEHLAHARVPSPPNTRRLPAEYVAEDTEVNA